MSDKKAMLIYFVVGLFGAFIIFMSSLDGDISILGIIFGGLVALIGFGFFAVFLIDCTPKNQERRRKEEEEREKRKKDREEALAKEREANPRTRTYSKAETFFEFCEKEGMTDLRESNVARLELMIDQNKLSISKDEITELFNKGKEEINARRKEIELNDLSVKERKLEAHANRFVNYYGRDKIIQIYKWHIRKYKRRIEENDREYRSIIDGTYATYQANKEKESDWAIHGGIASGIAGGAAGLAVASSVESRNEEIRARNAALQSGLTELAADAAMNVLLKGSQSRKKLEELEKLLLQAENMLVCDLPENELLEKISPKVVSVNISQTGAVKVFIETEAANLLILDDVQAVVDGALKIIISKQGKIIGEAFVALDFMGSYSKQTLATICLKPSEALEEDSEINVSIAPYRLWAVESNYFDKSSYIKYKDYSYVEYQ